MQRPVKSVRGVYYDLTKSPYEFRTPYGDCFKFSSQKKLDIYTRDIIKELKRVDDLFTRNDLLQYIPPEVKNFLVRMVYKAFYNSVEG